MQNIINYLNLKKFIIIKKFTLLIFQDILCKPKNLYYAIQK
jgi:hypothetical protein